MSLKVFLMSVAADFKRNEQFVEAAIKLFAQAGRPTCGSL